MGRVGLPWIIHGVTDELISECASISLKSSMVSFVWIGGHVHTKSVGAGRRVGKCLILGLAKFAHTPPWDQVCFIIVVPLPSLLNGSCYKKPGSVVQKHKLIQQVNAPQLPGEKLALELTDA